ncbi:MAG: helix-turn-helix domain-containing protein [Cyanobacteria bacterium P01_E01_bin.6]
MDSSLLENALKNPKSVLVKNRAVRILGTLNYDGLTIREIMEQINRDEDNGASYSVFKRILTLLQKEGFTTRAERPHENAGMPPTFVFYLSSDIGRLEKVRSLCKEELEQRLKNSSSDIQSEPLNDELVQTVGLADNFVNQCLSQLREASRGDHLEILKFVARKDRVTMIDASEELGILRQTVHARLTRLLELGLVNRLKERSPKGYLFSLSDNISQAERALLARECEVKQLHIAEDANEGLAVKKSSFSDDSSSAVQEVLQKLPGLPEYNEAWPDGLKTKWFELYERILEKSEP